MNECFEFNEINIMISIMFISVISLYFIVRPLKLFYDLFLIDPQKRISVQLCPFVRPGGMHNNFQPFLRSDKLGIDYSKLINFNVRDAIKKSGISKLNECELNLKRMIEEKQIPMIHNAITEALRAGIVETDPLIIQGRELLLQKY